MNENFLTLESEKRDRIINAAMQEFSLKGFKNASTNEIVKRASISKGALFHYFSSKWELFEFLYQYSIDVFLDTLIPKIESLPKDVMDRWSAFALLKMEIGIQYPLIFEFTFNANKDEDQEVQKFLEAVRERFSSDFTGTIYKDIDTTKFKTEIDINKALQIIWWTLEGFALSKQKATELFKIKDADYMQSMMRELEEYLTMLRKSFYKEEYI